jgi:hypothetical protein
VPERRHPAQHTDLHDRARKIGPLIQQRGRFDRQHHDLLLVVLETLSPLERAVFVLKEVFDFSYAEIGDAVERSESAVRQAAHRAREHVQARRPRFEADRGKKREATERFFAAVTGGEINALMDLLALEVTLWTDGGGKVRQAMRPIIGVANVAKWIAGTIRRPYEGVRNR